MDFSVFQINKNIINNLNQNNIFEPTKIQLEIIPLIFNNNDVLAKAPTGTGKTAAFAIPIVQLLLEGNQKFNPQALILCPTRELSLQIASTFKMLLKGYKDIKICSIIGGESIDKQVNQIKKGVDIVIATPGRLIDLIKQNKIDLSDINHFVLDEADLMLDMGFVKDINFIKSKLNNRIQSILLSATLPKSIEILSKNILKRNYKLVKANPNQETKESIQQYICHIEKNQKIKLLVSLIKQNPDKSFIIFINQKKNSNTLYSYLLHNKIVSVIIHSDKSQTFRSKAINSFKSKKIKVLIATDVASRGIHIDDVNFVINYDIPQNKEIYVHRIGRTGRAGKDGCSYTFVTNQDYYDLKKILKIKNNKYEVYMDDQFCHPLDIDFVLNERHETNKDRKHKRSNDTYIKYSNKKNYETKNDKKFKSKAIEHNKKVDANKKIKNFKWGSNKIKNNNKNFQKKKFR